VTDVGHISIEEFRQAMNELEDARLEGKEPEWMLPAPTADPAAGGGGGS